MTVSALYGGLGPGALALLLAGFLSRDPRGSPGGGYGFRAAVDVIGTRLVVFCPPSNPENVAYLRSFIRSGYRLEDAESHEIDRHGNAKYFVNNLVGIFERGQLVGAWGTQRDVTEQKGNPAAQEYRSRIHSAKSSSQ